MAIYYCALVALFTDNSGKQDKPATSEASALTYCYWASNQAITEA